MSRPDLHFLTLCLPALGLAGLLSLAVPAMAQVSSENWARCTNRNDQFPVPEGIIGCTALIQSGQLPARNLAIALYNRGNYYRRQGNLDAAIADYSQALVADPQYAPIYNNRAVAYRMKGDPARAVADFDQAIRINPLDQQAISNRATANFLVGNDSRALSDANEAIRLNSRDKEAFMVRCWVHLRRGRPQDAWGDCDSALRIAPDDAYAFYGRGNASARLGRLDNGRADMARGIALDRNVAQLYRQLGIPPPS